MWQPHSGAAPDIGVTAEAVDADASQVSASASFCAVGHGSPWPLPTGTALVDLPMPPRWLLASDPSARRRRDSGRPVSPGDVVRLSSMRQYLKAIDNAHGGGAVLPMADWYVRCEVIPLLNESHGDPESRKHYPDRNQLVCSWLAANACLDTHGGFGFAADFDVERKFRETRLYSVAPVSNNLILAYLGEHVLGLPRSY